MSTPETELTIVRMTAEHLPEVTAIEQDVFRDPWSAAAFTEVLSFTPHCWVALAGGRVAGYLITQWVVDEIHVLNVAVARTRQRTGVGRQLLEFLFRLAGKRGMSELFLEVRVGNAAAIALYRRFGFTVLATRRRYYSDGENALVMHCQLTARMPRAAAETETKNKR